MGTGGPEKSASAPELPWPVEAPPDFTQAQQLISELQKKQALNNEAIMKFARGEKYEELVASLELRPVSPLVNSVRNNGPDLLRPDDDAAPLQLDLLT